MAEKRKQLDEIFALLASVPAEKRNDFLSALVAEAWQPSPWSNMAPAVIDTARADVGVGVALYYATARQDVQVILMKAAGQEKYQIPGGFVNLTAAGDVTLALATVRETNEELVWRRGEPVLDFTRMAARLKDAVPLDAKKIVVRGVPRIVMSYPLPVRRGEFETVRDYAAALQADESLRSNLAAATNNEVDGIGIFPLPYLLQHPELLRHPDQASLFVRLARTFPRHRKLAALLPV